MNSGKVVVAGGFAFTLIAGVAVGVGLAASLLLPTTPESLRSSTPIDSVPITMQDYSDPRPVELMAEVSPPAELVVHRSGTITKWVCATGVEFVSGGSSLAVDGENVLNLATTVPLWRDLEVGDRGSDVSALERELDRLGHPVKADAVLSRGEMDAVLEIAEAADVPLAGRLDRSRVLWLTHPTVVVGSCAKQLGAPTVVGDTLAEAESGITLSSVTLPGDRLEGPRVLDLLDEPLLLDDAGNLPDAVDSAAVRRSQAFQAAASNSPDAPVLVLSTTASLQKPVEIAAVPATSVVVDGAGEMCVFSDGRALPVRVVGSEFGNSFVAFSNAESPDEIDVLTPEQSKTISCT